MAGLWQERQRLLREEKWTANGLAEELYAMISPDVPEDFQAPTTFHQTPGGAPAITITGAGEGDSVFDFKGRDGAKVGDIRIVNNTIEIVQRDKDTGAETTIAGASVAGGLRGTVVSGSGSSYVVNTSSGNKNVTQLQIDSGETIPAGTSVVLFRDASGYFMQVPVWL